MPDLLPANGYLWLEIRLEKLTAEERKQLITLLVSIQTTGSDAVSNILRRDGLSVSPALLSEIFSRSISAESQASRIASEVG